jgi:tetratricopeptide (TPR) repeat protein
LSNVNPVAADNGTILRMIQACKAAEAAGRNGEADQLLTRAAQLAPAHPAVLNELGMRMMQRNEPAKARELFQRATRVDPGHPALWANLAASLDALGLQQEQFEAIEKALTLDPRHLSSLLQKGALIEARGDARNAARAYRNALATVPPGATPVPAVSGMIDRARAAVRADDEALASAMEAQLAAIRARHGGANFKRVDRCVEILTGRRTRYNSEPAFMYFPELPAIEFF